ncbi:copper chaperone NosL [Salegentibacter echinorum]|uniref:Copper chaperone NosL n=1 Tax=Salegentibacter echinorum TaxID=1073325 RepID=A0A1M5EBT7_SALEC|nr:nitrous oxide reductase accessory protein NosL [Salegentibacter echinorum]SHF76733.1 copper chaperone NosL [Salegentibacter echinorum]
MKNYIFLFVSLLLVACSTEPEPIVYGSDACDFCEMTIVDKEFAAQSVSDKGKQFKYDAIECMLNDHLQKDTKMAVKLVANFHDPGKMLEVDHAKFVQNDSINSPMGGHLAAFSTKNPQAKKAGIYTWQELQLKFKE